ncbi:MAG: acetate/propionate family kinase [Reyranellales bacterium]
MDTILVVNAGSSSLKFQVFALADAGDPTRLLKGQMDGIGTRPRLRAEAADSQRLVDRIYAQHEVKDVPAAIAVAGAWLRETQAVDLVAAGHRVVHGGPDYDRPLLIDDQVLARLERYTSLAPLHQPNNLAPIRELRARQPALPQVACFDTAFHRTHGVVPDHFALPEHFYAEGVRRYGFHGLSYEYVAERLRQVAPDLANGRVIVAHLGSGASMCALAGGRSVESTMGFTALDGLPMGTRPGQIDPGVVLHLITDRGMTAAQVQDLLYHQSGLKGLSGVSNDMRELEASADPRSAFAIDYFVYRVGLQAGMLAAALGGLDGFVFTGGIGENSASMRARIAEKLAWLGAELDPAANAAGHMLMSRRGSRPALYMLPTDEELMIARHTLALLSRRSAQQTVTAA